MPSGLGAPSDDSGAPLTPAFDIPRLQPFPDARFDPEVRAGIRLALVAATQILPARQRAVLVLREVLEFSAAEGPPAYLECLSAERVGAAVLARYARAAR
ncbi:hypothetical protein [Streptomyces sp. NBC_00223]|uniref:hypothetical protein n=1 Tax=Streptomyces sp. NBC_00223 TaxID=2976008 RepID=UPI002E2C047D|nr:hypothetical protein [Streptomyces sp. NBC_00223]